MSRIDSSIYSQMRAPDLIGGFMRGVETRQVMDQRNRQRDLNETMKAGVVKNPDGTTTYDPNKTYESLLGKGFVQEANEIKQNQLAQDQAKQKMQFDKQLQQTDLISRAAGSATDQQSYEQALGMLAQNGVDVSQLPRAYDPRLVQRYQMMAMTAKEQLENQRKQEEFGLKKSQADFDQNYKNKELDIKKREIEGKKRQGESLPIDKKKLVETLSTKNAGKIAIKNQIDAVMSTWDSLTDDQKVAQGRSLLKTLNSTEGADAIGVEEANRLGSKLEFAVGNLTNSNPTQFGRDLEGFATQARAAAKNIGSAVSRNQSVIDENLGRKVSKSVDGQQTLKTNQIEWAD